MAQLEQHFSVELIFSTIRNAVIEIIQARQTLGDVGNLFTTGTVDCSNFCKMYVKLFDFLYLQARFAISAITGSLFAIAQHIFDTRI
jgi:hypothetical protein